MRPNRARVALVISSAAESLVRSVWMVSNSTALGLAPHFASERWPEQ